MSWRKYAFRSAAAAVIASALYGVFGHFVMGNAEDELHLVQRPEGSLQLIFDKMQTKPDAAQKRLIRAFIDKAKAHPDFSKFVVMGTAARSIAHRNRTEMGWLSYDSLWTSLSTARKTTYEAHQRASRRARDTRQALMELSVPKNMIRTKIYDPYAVSSAAPDSEWRKARTASIVAVNRKGESLKFD